MAQDERFDGILSDEGRDFEVECYREEDEGECHTREGYGTGVETRRRKDGSRIAVVSHGLITFYALDGRHIRRECLVSEHY